MQANADSENTTPQRTPEPSPYDTMSCLLTAPAHVGQLSKPSQERLDRDPLRILDSKDVGDHAILAEGPTLAEHLTQAEAGR
jgi:hypothetical protein